MTQEFQTQIDEIDELLKSRYTVHCPICHALCIEEQMHDLKRWRVCTNCYVDAQEVELNQRIRRYEDSVARDPYLGNGGTEDRRRASRHETGSKSGMF